MFDLLYDHVQVTDPVVRNLLIGLLSEFGHDPDNQRGFAIRLELGHNGEYWYLTGKDNQSTTAVLEFYWGLTRVDRTSIDQGDSSTPQFLESILRLLRKIERDHTVFIVTPDVKLISAK